MNEKVTIEFTPAHLDIVWGALQNGPYQQVAPVIESIQRQVNAQHMPPAPEEPEDADADSGTE